jgi:hypothetical protein
MASTAAVLSDRHKAAKTTKCIMALHAMYQTVHVRSHIASTAIFLAVKTLDDRLVLESHPMICDREITANPDD